MLHPHRMFIAAMLAGALGLLAGLGGCVHKDVRALTTLPEPVFLAPTTQPGLPGDPPPPHAPAPDDLEAAWRNHAAPARPWQWIVIHHSSTPGGGAVAFDKFHREVRGWDELGYHFVIGNGTDTADGCVEIGGRWTAQKHGAHAATPSRQFNQHGVGVCLVGDFEKTRPTARQLAAAVRLCAFLCDEYNVRPDHIVGHRDAQAAEGKITTDCPGRNMDLPALRTAVAQELNRRSRAGVRN